MASLKVRRSEVHGQGAFARVALARGALVGIYEGRRYSEAEALTKNWGSSITYLFGLSDGTVIDGAEGGNATRHLNHSCQPNCEAVEYEDLNGNLSLRIETIRRVAAGEELTLDYALQVDPADRDAHPCACSSARCRGTLVAPT